MPLFQMFTLAATPPTWETHQRFALEVDWQGDGSFLNADISSDVVGEVQCVRGRDYASQLTGRSVAGTLQATLRNDDGRYSSLNGASPLFGSILPGRKVRAWAMAPYNAVLWTGFLDTIEPIATGGEPRAILRASGVLKTLGDQASRGYPAPQVEATTGEVIDAILDSVGHPASARSIEDGVVEVGAWFTGPEGIIALEGFQQMEETEVGGWLYENLDFGVNYEARYHRLLTAASVTSQATFSDNPSSNLPYIGIRQQDSIREIYNEITADITPYNEGSIAVLWTLPEQPYLAPGASITLKALYTGSGFVLPWTTPVVSTDVIGTGGTLAVALVSSSGSHIAFTITNNHATEGSSLTTIQVRGVAWTPGSVTQVRSADAVSQAIYRKRVYPLGSPWYANTNDAQAACNYFLSRQKDPHPIVEMVFTGTSSNALAQQAASRALSDRVTVVADDLLTQMGLGHEMFVESITHSFGPSPVPWVVSLMLSPGVVETHYWQLGDATYSILGTTTIPAY